MYTDRVFDVFLSYAHVDAAWVDKIAVRLDDAGFKVWLDKWILIPGEPWQRGMAQGLETARCCAVCIGAQTPKGWFRQEIQKALNRYTSDPSFRVIPVLLPGANRGSVEEFLELLTWVDFSDGIDSDRPFHVLVSGIKGLPPGRYNPAVLGLSAISERHIRGSGNANSARGVHPTTASDYLTVAASASSMYEGPRIMGRPFPELRPDLIAGTVDKLSSPGDIRILFVSGPSRVGKSHLCRSLMGTLVQSYGVQAHTFSVASDSLPLLRRIGLSLFPSSQVAAPADLAISLAQSSARRLIHISNCQDLPVQEVQALASLFAELDARAWESVQFLLEVRTVKGRGNGRAFVKELSDKISGWQEVPVEHLTLREIIHAVDQLFLTDQAARIAGVLKKKAGSDPFSLIHTLQYLITHGILRWNEDGEREYLTINDNSAFFGRMNRIPDEISSLLRKQIEEYRPSSNEGTPELLPYGNRLALLAAVGPNFDRIRQATALGLTLNDLRRMDFQLIRDGFLAHAGPDKVDFSQEVTRLAAEAYGRDNDVFWEVAYSLVEAMNEHTAHEEIIAGTLYHCIRDYEKALSCYRAALELAKKQGDYSVQRAALIGCIRCSDMLQPNSLVQKEEWINWRVELGWNEMQAGSQKQALDHLRNALDYARDLLLHHGHSETKLLQRETVRIRQRMLTCMLDCQQIRECLKLLESLVPTIEDVKHLFDTTNRFVLLCYMTGEATSGYTAACWGLAMADVLNDPESKSVILSDIGHLLLLRSPEQAAHSWRRCLDAAQELRQQTHAQTNCLVADLMMTRSSNGDVLHNLFQTVQTQTGTSIQLARLHMYTGVQLALNADWENAVKHFELARSHAAAFGLVSDEWEANNNLGVAYIALNNQELAHRSFSLAALRVHSMIKECDAKRIATISLLLVSQARKLEIDVQALEQTSLVAPPSFTGLFWTLLYNIEKVKHRGLPISLPKDFGAGIEPAARSLVFEIIGSESYPLRVNTGQETLVLALE